MKAWTYILKKSKKLKGDYLVLTETERLGKWKYRIEKTKFEKIFNKLCEIVKNHKKILNSKYVHDKGFVELNVYCLDKDKSVYDELIKQIDIIPYRWKSDKETINEFFDKSLDYFLTDLKKMLPKNKEQRNVLIAISIRDFVTSYNKALDYIGPLYKRIDEKKIPGIIKKVKKKLSK